MQLSAHDRILFQGDSITHAFRQPEEVGTSYRLGAGWVMLVAAQLHAEHAEMAIEVENRGVCGQGVKELLARWQEDCIAVAPTVLSILVGVNDTIKQCHYGTDRPVDRFEQNYRTLLAQARAALPALRLVLCEPFLLETGDVTRAWRDDLRTRQQIVLELAAEFDAVFVPLQARFDAVAARTSPEHWLFDGIHANAAGQWLMAQAWREHVLGDGQAVSSPA
jgi:lysophospholipase L1-like esterase